MGKVIKIEQGIKPENDGRGRPSKYPFDRMRVGDSIHITDEYWASARSAAYVYAKKHGIKFTTQQTKQGIRIWRAE